jgi:hypothetical protein
VTIISVFTGLCSTIQMFSSLISSLHFCVLIIKLVQYSMYLYPAFTLSFPVVQKPKLGLGHLLLQISRSHTVRYTTQGRTPLDERSVHHRDLYLTTQKHSQETNIHAPSGIQTQDPSKGSAKGPCLRLRSHWDQPTFTLFAYF